MAEDKKIRVSADLSQMRSLREEASSLHREVVHFSEEQNKLTDRAINQLKEQLSLLKDRNDLEKLFGELKEKNSRLPFQPAQRSITNENREISENSEDIETINRDRHEENVHENVVNIERNTQNIEENTSVTKRQTIEQETQPFSDKPRPTRIEDRREYIDTDRENAREIAGVSSKDLNALSSKMITAFDLQNTIIRSLMQKIDISNRSFNSIIDIISSIDESLYKEDRNPFDSPTPTVPPVIPIPSPNPSDPGRNQNRPTEPYNIDVREKDQGWKRAGNIGTRIIAGVGASMGQSPVSMTGSLISGAGGIAGEALGMIPGVGGFLGGMATAAANVYASIFTSSIEKAFDAQRKAVSYSQTMGVSNSQAMRIAGSEGGYAASALGMNIGDYIQRRADLIRSAGGKEGVSSVSETQSLMSAERLYGLSPQSINQLQRTMRFSDEEGTRSSSSVIRIFEQTMKQLQLPFSEIASTMEESLTSFNRTADSVLSKAGDFDAAKIASVLAGVRAYTGAEGRQLERYQQAFTGQSISQDDTTQAYLLRALMKSNPSISTHSEAMSRIETIEESPKLVRSFVKTLSEMTSTQEQFIQVLKSAFTNLSYTDIRKLLEEGKQQSGGDWRKSLEPLFLKIEENTKKIAKQNEDTNRYAPNAAQKTVSSGEALMSAYENKMIALGETNLPKLQSILESINQIKDTLIQSPDKVSGFLSAMGSPMTKDFWMKESTQQQKDNYNSSKLTEWLIGKQSAEALRDIKKKIDELF